MSDKTGKEMYESWAHQQSNRCALPRWDDLPGSTKIDWNKQAIYCRLASPPAMNAASPTKAQALADTDQVPYLIVFDDQDRENEPVIGGTRAHYRFKQISGSWNAHLFVKIASNSRDEKYPSASLAAPAGQGSATSGEAAAIRPWQERRPGGKMDSQVEYMQAEIDDLRTALAASAEQSNTPVLYQMQMRAPNGRCGPWHETSIELFDKYRANPDIGDGFTNEVRALFTTPVAERAAAPASVPRDAEIYAEMSRREPNWNAYQSSRDRAVMLAIQVMRDLLAAPEVAQPAAQGERAAPSEEIIKAAMFDSLLHVAECSGFHTVGDAVQAGIESLAWGAKRAPGSAASWKVFTDETVFKEMRPFDIVLKNGVTLYSQHYSTIDWTAVRDWRYSDLTTPAPTAGEPSAAHPSDAPAGGGGQA
jgi:hypothetical protein